MKVSERWLRSLVNPKVSTQEWVEQFTQAGIEVDSVEREGSQDTILTLKVPPNRSDCLSMEGLAREWAAMNKMSFTTIKVDSHLPNIKTIFPVSVIAKEACPRYVGRIIQNTNNKTESPSWLKEHLEKAGIRSLSPVVDVTNYVMLELGQPMHAFDLAKLDSEIIVRMAKKNENIVTLDDKKLELDEDTLVIADKTKPLAIAGVMGGEESSVTENTQTLFLESAYFDPVHIRKTGQRYKLRTESSIRYERGIDPYLQVKAMERATELLVKIVGGNVGPLIECGTEYLSAPITLVLRSSRITEVLGITLERAVIEDLLTRLGIAFKTKPESQDTAISVNWEISIPSFRPDITLEIDLIEEIARLYGYQNIPEALPNFILAGNKLPEHQIALHKIKDLLISRGYYEAITYSFISPQLHQCLQSEVEPLVLSNPISQDMSIMRESLIPGLLQALYYNQARQNLRVRLFEVGTTFIRKKEQKEWEEKSMLGGVASGSVFKEQWGEKTRNIDFFDVKNDVETLLCLKNEEDLSLRFRSFIHPMLHPGQSAEICLGETVLGYLGALHPALIKQLDLQGPVIVFEMSLQALQTTKRPKFREMSKFPAIRRDIAVIVDEKVLAIELKSAIVNCVGSLLRDVWVFDVYQGKGIEPGRKSMALGLLLQHPTRTLVEEEVNEMMSKIVEQLTHRYQAILRE